MFVSVDFGLVRDGKGGLEPKLVELQAFPSLYGYQAVSAQQYIEQLWLAPGPGHLPQRLDHDSYRQLMRELIVGGHDPENVILMEIDPLAPEDAARLPDHAKRIGDRDRRYSVAQEARQESCTTARTAARSKSAAHLQPLHRRGAGSKRASLCLSIYATNSTSSGRDIPTGISASASSRFPTSVTAACLTPGSSTRIRACLTTTRTTCLSRSTHLPGAGIKFAPTEADIDAIPAGERHNYILQERMRFEPVIETPHGMTQMEMRIMYVWPESGELTAGSAAHPYGTRHDDGRRSQPGSGVGRWLCRPVGGVGYYEPEPMSRESESTSP